MEFSKEIHLGKVPFGSHLYGTSTDQSDFDYKVICLPSLDSLLLGRRIVNRVEKPVGCSASNNMQAGQTETEYIPVQTFLDDFFAGQAYAIEAAFAISQRMSFAPDPGYEDTLLDVVNELLHKFLTKDVRKMVGYAVKQAQVYGLKSQRFTSLKQFIETVEHHFDCERWTEQRLGENAALLDKLLLIDHVHVTTLMNTKGGSKNVPALDVCGKKFPMSCSLSTVMSSVLLTLEEYGQRVKEFDGAGADLKALSHAIRIIEQLIDLTRDGKLVFPRPNAEFLLGVRNSHVPLTDAIAYFDTVFSTVDKSIETSPLQEKTPELVTAFNEWKVAKLQKLYFNDF